MNLPLDEQTEIFSHQTSLIFSKNFKTTVIAWSLGGLYAIKLCQHFQTHIKRLILVASTPCFIAQASWPGIPQSVSSRFHYRFIINPAKQFAYFLSLILHPYGSSQVRRKLKEHCLFTADRIEQLTFSLNKLFASDLRDIFASLTIPIYLIGGCKDSLVQTEAIRRMMLLNSNVTSFILPDASHAPFISHTHTFNEIIHEIISYD